MTLLDLVAIAAPALLIVTVAVCLVTRGRVGPDTVIDLRDVPTVVLAVHRPSQAVPPNLPPVSGALIDPVDGGSLGARMRSVAPTERVGAAAQPATGSGAPAGCQPGGAAPAGQSRVVLVRRRRRPLVAVSREP